MILNLGDVFQFQLGTYGGTTNKMRVLRQFDISKAIESYNNQALDPITSDFVNFLIDWEYIEVLVDDGVAIIKIDDDHYMQQVKLGELD